MSSSTTLTGALDAIRNRHFEFVEANYHLRNERLLKERRQLMHEGVLLQTPWVEATPAYEPGPQIGQLRLPPEVAAILSEFARAGLGVYDPPYKHQASALEAFFSRAKDLVVSTGTGSGKTEIFLYTILGLLAKEGARNRTPAQRGIRALILYPMNALVADQLSRLRLMFGSRAASEGIARAFHRTVQFGMYTSRTPYPGARTVEKDDRNLRVPMKYYLGLVQDPARAAQKLELEQKGKIPAKDLVGFADHRFRKDRYWTQKDDRELIARHEMLSPDNTFGGTPDILITNYSMLQYMLLRPIEQPLFETTRQWLAADRENQLLLVLDEAHLYRGAQGAEVALLIRRLVQRLGVDRSRVRCILTSASLGDETTAESEGAHFGAELAGGPQTDFEVILGSVRRFNEGGRLDPGLAGALATVGQSPNLASIAPVAKAIGLAAPPATGDIRTYLGRELPDSRDYRVLYDSLSRGPRQLNELSHSLFPGVPDSEAQEATLAFLLLGTTGIDGNGNSILPVRVHLFAKGLARQFVCVNSDCTRVRVAATPKFLGRIFNETREFCECGGRTFELLSHRTCGATYIKAYRRANERGRPTSFLWNEGSTDSGFDEIHILLDEPRRDPDLRDKTHTPLFVQHPVHYLHPMTGMLFAKDPGVPSLRCWIPRDQPDVPAAPWTWSRCPACGILERLREDGTSYVMDLETKGEEPFANLVKTAFQIQPPTNLNPDIPNKGRKVLCFSDSRQKAARLARDLQYSVQLDSFRELVVLAARKLPPDFGLDQLFPQILAECIRLNLTLFDDSDRTNFSDGSGYPGSRTEFTRAKEALAGAVRRLRLGSDSEAALDVDVCRELAQRRPVQFINFFLRQLGDRNYSVEATLVAAIVPGRWIVDGIAAHLPQVPRQLLEETIEACIRNAIDARAIDEKIGDAEREQSRAGRAGVTYRRASRGWGLSPETLIPPHIREEVVNRVNDAAAADIETWMRRTIAGRAPLFTSYGDRWVLDPRAITIEVDFGRVWYRCNGCHQFVARPFQGACPRAFCGGSIARVDPSDPHLHARKAFFRDPCERVFNGSQEPFIIRAEEHSAQISTKDYTQVFSKSEKYELLFRDILPEPGEAEQPVDVLSCTTTMEVGIDIGSLTSVSLRTVPPRTDNYQQRAGRAGRRGAGLSVILTYADNSPHEAYHFEHPELMIGRSASAPIIYVDNEKIAGRHVNASLVQHFFNRDLPPGRRAALMSTNSNLFASLGDLGSFFGGAHEYSHLALESWVRSAMVANDGPLHEIAQLLPADLPSARAGGDWRKAFVTDAATSFLADLAALKVEYAGSPDLGETNLLDALLERSILPTFSFPTDVCKFTVREYDWGERRVQTTFEPQVDMIQALSEYVPGREIVIDKRTFTPYGLSFDIATDLLNRAASQRWDKLELLNFCPDCGTIVDDKHDNLEASTSKCVICGSAIRTLPVYTPEGFAPESLGRRAKDGEPVEGVSSRATSARFPLPTGTPTLLSELSGSRYLRILGGTAKNEQLVVANFGGRDQSGFWICRRCGALACDSPPRPDHNRPYPQDVRAKAAWPSRCKGGEDLRAALGFSFRTDLAILRVPLDGQVDVNGLEGSALAYAARSLAEALVLGATRSLGIDASELGGGYRLMPVLPGDSSSIRGNIDFFLYDTTSGGAGFALRAWKSIGSVLEASMAVLEHSCTCSTSCPSCLRTYDNRYEHLRLNRFLASSLMYYMHDAKVPPIDPNRLRALLEPVVRSVELLDMGAPTLTASYESDGVLLERHGRRLHVHVIPALTGGNTLEVRVGADGSSEVRVSEFKLITDRPLVSYELQAAIT